MVAPLSVWGEDYEAFEQNGRLVFQSAERLLDLPLPALIGQHQIGNAGTAVAAALRLQVARAYRRGYRGGAAAGALAGAHAAARRRAAGKAASAGL